jgi:hypothetical protein
MTKPGDPKAPIIETKTSSSESAGSEARTDLILPALKIGPAGSVEEITVNLSMLTSRVFVQPGITPPSEVINLSEAFKNTTDYSAKGCTSEATAISAACRKKVQYGYVLSSKSSAELLKAYNENMEAAKTANKPNPFLMLILISDENFAFAKMLNTDTQQTIGEKQYYRRFIVKFDEGVNKGITYHDSAELPAITVQRIFDEQKDATTSIGR